MKHTQGPWKTVVGNLHHGGVEKMSFVDVMSARGNSIVRFEGLGDSSDETKKANARLIAAAPEMLDALERATSRFGLDGENEDIKEIVRNVIAKARGES